MKNMIIRVLIIIVLTFVGSSIVLANIFSQEQFKTHLRWNLNVARDHFFINKREGTLNIETVNLEMFDALSKELAQIKLDSDYVESLTYSKDNFPAKPATISVKLKTSSVELFSFYRDADKRYILDFWINSDLLSESPRMTKPLPLPVDKKKSEVKLNVKKEADVNQNLVQKSSLLTDIEIPENKPDEIRINPEYRDFRYGASFIWDQPPMIPQMEKDLNLASKIPDTIYPIKDRVLLDDSKEAHVQLSINFYREGKWGLMNKSITLYEKKYGRDVNSVTNDFLKANALLKGNLAKPNKGVTQSAILLLSNVKDMTEDYELKSSIYRYLLQYYVDSRDYVKTLELAKELFVEARGQFDQNLVIQTALTILHSLSELKQIEKIEEFLSDKKLASILPPQMGLAYSSYAMLSQGQTKDIIRKYKSVESSLTKPVHPAILFNVAESYFRESKYEESIKLFDEFLVSHSYLLQAPFARLRIALGYELLDKPVSETLVLYRNAIDRSTDPAARFEAKLRYVGLRVARKLRPSEEDIETEVFLEQSPDETKVLNSDLKKMLWLVRLRLLIVSKKYDQALAYLASVPLDSLKPAERRVFEGDGAEVVYGVIQEAYYKEDYIKAIKLWEVYKEKYESKVAKNVYMNFIVCDSFIKLGLYKSYDRALISLKNAQKEEARKYPAWVDKVKSNDVKQMLEELELLRVIAEQKWQEASDKLASYSASLRDSINYSFYKGLVSFNLKKFTEAVGEFEKVLVQQSPKVRLTPRQMADLLMGYVESLYQLKDQDKFKTIVKALSKDIQNSKSAPILNVSERVEYLLIESYAGETNADWKEIENMTKGFRGKFQKSPYTSRIGYLYGLSLIKNLKVLEGKEVLTTLRDEDGVPLHIKEMCKSELATLELVDKKF